MSQQPKARRGPSILLLALLLAGPPLLAASQPAATAPPPPAVSSHSHHAASPSAAKHANPGANPAPTATKTPPTFTGDRAETQRLIDYERTLALTPAQEAIRVAALTPLAAPCCKQFSAATCCCRCNMMRARDGLAKHMIANQGADAAQVRTAVESWHHAINPDGFSGDTCSTGGCNRSFKANGCGGMKAGELVF